MRSRFGIQKEAIPSPPRPPCKCVGVDKIGGTCKKANDRTAMTQTVGGNTCLVV